MNLLDRLLKLRSFPDAAFIHLSAHCDVGPVRIQDLIGFTVEYGGDVLRDMVTYQDVRESKRTICLQRPISSTAAPLMNIPMFISILH